MKVRIWRTEFEPGATHVEPGEFEAPPGMAAEVVAEVSQEVWDRYLAADVRLHFARKALFGAAGWREVEEG